MVILKPFFIIVIGVVLILTVRQYKPEYTVFIVLAIGVIVFSLISTYAGDILDSLSRLFKYTNVNNDFIKILLKILGICIITQLTSDICRDAGESALATKSELIGKIIMLVSAMPIITSIADIVLEFTE